MCTSKLSALFLTTALAMGMSGQALALDVGQKGSFAQIEKELSRERQVEIARAKYVLNREDPAKMKELCVKFTINAAGEAYILISDNMGDSKARTQIVYGKLKNAHASDPRNVGVLPLGVSGQSNLAKLIKQGVTIGDGVLLHGESVKVANGSDIVVGLTTVMANLSNSKDPTVGRTVAILVTTTNDVTSLDKVSAFELQYRGIPAN